MAKIVVLGKIHFEVGTKLAPNCLLASISSAVQHFPRIVLEVILYGV